MKRFLIAAMNSGSGKTVVTMGLLRAFKEQGLSVISYKCGPDYIDPMFHERVLGVPCRNLDTFLMGEEQVRREVTEEQADLAILEGAMGYFDGLSGTWKHSAYHVASLTKTPVILVINPAGESMTLAAKIGGLQNFAAEDLIAGIILNNCSEAMYRHLAPILEASNGVPVLGYLPKLEEAKLESRHLGLVTAAEVENFETQVAAIAATMREHIDLKKLLKIAGKAEKKSKQATQPEEAAPVKRKRATCKIAVAKDEGFCFYYGSSLRALEENGVKLEYFSPIHDEKLPEDADGLYLGGGYPELYAAQLGQNKSMKDSIKAAIRGGMPTVAECGGFLYLQKELTDEEGAVQPMIGIFDGSCTRQERLVRFGYSHLKAEEDSMLFKAGETIPCHEFHYWDTTDNGTDLSCKKPGKATDWKCGFAGKTMYAGFPHLSLVGEINLAARFAAAAKQYHKEHH